MVYLLPNNFGLQETLIYYKYIHGVPPTKQLWLARDINLEKMMFVLLINQYSNFFFCVYRYI